MSDILLSKVVSYDLVGSESALAPASGRQLVIHKITAQNRVGSTIDVGLATKIPNDGASLSTNMSVYTLDATATPDAVASTLLDGDTTDIFSTATDDGFLVQATVPFGLVSIVLSQAQSGSPIEAYTYYDGDAYVALTTVDVPATWGVGINTILFVPPHDWATGTTDAVGGDTDKYSLRVIASTAPGQAVQATSIIVGELIEFKEGVLDNAELVFTSPQIGRGNNGLLLEAGSGIIPYFGTAAAANKVSFLYETQQ